MSSKVSDRYDKFLSNYDFFSNSIQFRIQSSKALEKFKNVQSFQLNQIVNGRFFFAQDRREILLLKYDLWSRWLYEVENLCIELSEDYSRDVVTSQDLEGVVELAVKTSEKYKSIILEEHYERFDTEFSSIWLEVHEDVFDYMLNTIRAYEGYSFIRLFTSVVDLVVDIMQHTLIELCEVDSLFCKLSTECQTCKHLPVCPNEKFIKSKDQTPFVILNKFAEKVHGTCIVCDRIQIYKKYFDFSKIFIKNYTDEQIPEDLIERIEEMGLEIDYKKCIIA